MNNQIKKDIAKVKFDDPNNNEPSIVYQKVSNKATPLLLIVILLLGGACYYWYNTDITRKASERICRFAFDYAVKNGRKEVCAVSKANIMKLSDGLFLESYRNVAQDYPQIKQREILVDNLCMQLVQEPSRFDVLVLPNLYGDIVSDLTAGLIGGLGVAQGANIGLNCAVFEPVHGSAPDIKGQNKANPTALLLSAIEMLRYINETDYAIKIEKALFKTLSDGDKTADLGGYLSTTEFTDMIIKNLL